MATVGTEQAGGKRKEYCQHAGGLDTETVDLDEIPRQPERHRDRAAEGKEIVNRKTPDLEFSQRCEPIEKAHRLLTLEFSLF